jgi:hypothetical protein
MTCPECELKLAMGEDVDEHLASCAECRWLAQELRLNALALSDMKVKPRLRWEWVLVTAAAIVLAIGVAEKPGARSQKAERIEVTAAVPVPKAEVVSPLAHVRPQRAKKSKPAESLRVKMFTSDPDVVIYWIVDRKEGSE